MVEQKEYTSTDLGNSWGVESPLARIPYSAVLHGRQLIQSPATPNFQYRRLQEVGRYLRSEDAGQTWLLPHFAVKGETRDAFPLSDVSKFYTNEFRLLAIHPMEPRHLYAQIIREPWAAMIWMNGPLANIEVPGVYESFDGGENWQSLLNAPLRITTLGISPANPSLFYASGPSGVLKSESAGKDWSIVGQNELLTKRPLTNWDKGQEIDSGPRVDFEVYQFVLDPQDPQVVFIVSNKGFYLSTDGAKSWCLLNLGFDELGSATSLAINPRRPEEIFLGTNRGVFYSKDRGGHVEKIFPKE